MRRYASLRRQGEFARLRQRGRRAATPSLTIFMQPPAPRDPAPLVGITVSSSVGKAVVRNKLRRRLSAIFDQYFSSGSTSGRYLVIARPSAAARSFDELRSELFGALQA